MPYTLPLGSKLPHFSLASTEGAIVSSTDFKDTPFLVIFFTCNHCPYVLCSDEVTRKTALHYQRYGVQFIGINPNSPDHYEEDSFYRMVERMHQNSFPWLYLYDAKQEVVKLFGPLKTPHFFVFDYDRELVYCGRGIDSPLAPKKSTVNDLENALKSLVEGKKIEIPLTNPIGCSIKWKGHEDHWMPEDACDLVP